MREMKDSGIEWIGEIPTDWNLKKLKHTFAISSGTTPKSDNLEYWDGDIPWVTPADYKTEDKYVYHGRKFLSEAGLNAANLQLLPVNSIIFSKRAPIGVVAITGAKLAINQGCISCVPAIECDIRYYYFILSIYTEQFNLLGSGTTFKEISSKDFGNFTVPAPSVSVQEKLADYLDHKCSQIDAIIARQQEVIEKLKAYKLSVITEAVTKGLNPNVPMKDSGVEWAGEIPEHWENRKMISILSMRVVDGPHESPELYDEGIPYISATAIENGKINFDLMRGYISEEYCDICDLRYKPQLHDILVIKLGASTGQVAIVETTDRFNIWVPLAAVRCNEKANPYFVYYAFQSDYFLKQMEMSWTYGTQQTLGVKSIERLRIMLPTLDEQKEIVSYLKSKCDSIDAAVKNKENLINKLAEYKKSLIYEVVTGKKEV